MLSHARSPEVSVGACITVLVSVGWALLSIIGALSALGLAVAADGERKIYERDGDSGYRIRFHFCSYCGSKLYWEGDRNPAVCGVAVGAFDKSAFPPPSDSIWEASMYSWLGLPPGTERHRQGRPPVTNEAKG